MWRSTSVVPCGANRWTCWWADWACVAGGKTITFFGSIVLTVNNVSGPGMLALPVVYQQGKCRVFAHLDVSMCMTVCFPEQPGCSSHPLPSSLCVFLPHSPVRLPRPVCPRLRVVPRCLTVALLMHGFDVAATFMCDSMARLKGNNKFQRRVEFATAFREWFGRKWYIVVQVAFVLCLMSQTLASIIYTAQVRVVTRGRRCGGV